LPRITIDEFRARLSGGDAGPLAEAYREITRRPELRRPAAAMLRWGEWPPAAVTPAA
jgi:hypothetical protein